MLGVDAYNWWKLLHVLGVLGFVMFHGISAWVAVQLRTERDRTRIAELLRLSGASVRGMYVSLMLLTTFGVVAAFDFGWWSYAWIWIAIGILVAIIGEMAVVARPYYQRLKEAVEVRPSGVPRTSDQELDQILRSRLAIWNGVLGVVALVALTWLMVFKPSWRI